MKKLIYISAATLALTSQTVAFADNSGMDVQDFKQLVCSQLAETSDKQVAMTEVLAMTESLIDSSQKETLAKLATEQLSSQSFCSDVDI